MWIILTLGYLLVSYITYVYKYIWAELLKKHCGLCVKYHPDQPTHVAQANHDRHFSPPVGFLFQESLLYTSIPLRLSSSARISLRRMRRLILVGTLRRVHNVSLFTERLDYFIYEQYRPRLARTFMQSHLSQHLIATCLFIPVNLLISLFPKINATLYSVTFGITHQQTHRRMWAWLIVRYITFRGVTYKWGNTNNNAIEVILTMQR